MKYPRFSAATTTTTSRLSIVETRPWHPENLVRQVEMSLGTEFDASAKPIRSLFKTKVAHPNIGIGARCLGLSFYRIGSWRPDRIVAWSRIVRSESLE